MHFQQTSCAHISGHRPLAISMMLHIWNAARFNRIPTAILNDVTGPLECHGIIRRQRNCNKNKSGLYISTGPAGGTALLGVKTSAGSAMTICGSNTYSALQWRHNGRDSVSNHQPLVSLLSRLFRRRTKKTSRLRVTGLCAGNSPTTGEFPAQMASNAENVSIWWRYHGTGTLRLTYWFSMGSPL